MTTWARRELGPAALALGVALALRTVERAMASEERISLGPIDEGEFVDVRGYPEWVAVRGDDRRKPVLLMLNGGPGVPTAPSEPVVREWEKDFTLVLWDQPGGGATQLKALADGKGEGEFTIDRYVRDALAVAQWAARRLGKRQIALFGISFGTILGLEMIRRRPDLFFAYLGTAQVVGGPGNLMGYQMALTAARKRGDTKAIADLERVGPPPYGRFEDFLTRQTYTNPPGLPPSPADAAATAEMTKRLAAPPTPGAHYLAPVAPPAGYNWWEAFLATQRKTFQEVFAWDAQRLGRVFKVPVFVVQGEDDLNAPTPAARAWFDQIEAPAKAFEIIPGASHNTLAFHDVLLKILEQRVLPIASRRT
jgi:pimeloyl-ACP methyl ester carboxylesterase